VNIARVLWQITWQDGKLQIQEEYTSNQWNETDSAGGAWNILFITMENACLPTPYLIFRYRKNGSNSLAG